MARVYSTAPGSVPNDIDWREGYLAGRAAFEKGLTPPPFKLEHHESSSVVRVVFEQTELAKCICEIACQKAGTVTKPFCPEDEDYSETFTTQVFLEDDATYLSFLFTDALGNQTTIVVPSLLKTIPGVPVTAVDGASILVGVGLASRNGTSLKDAITHYQIERYVRNETNKTLWVDWTPIGLMPGTHTDRNVISGVTHGYRVRFRAAFDNPSRWSDWTTQSV